MLVINIKRQIAQWYWAPRRKNHENSFHSVERKFDFTTPVHRGIAHGL